MNRFDYLVDILAVGPNLYHLLAGRGLASLDQMLDILATLESTNQEPWETLVPVIEPNLEAISSVVCVFLDWDEARRAFASHLLHCGAAVKIIVVRDVETSGACALDPLGSWPDEIIVLGEQQFKAGVRTI